ncbi:U32 family peptidase [bacterium]|nr:U32 family peptidase [bacterium]
MLKPEILAPAGNLEKLKVAFAYGADAVYVGGTEFGLRAGAGNFNLYQLQEAVDYTNKLNKKIYLVLNVMAHNEDIDRLVPYLEKLNEIQPHAFIVADAGVLELARKHTKIELHLSTQASSTNAFAMEFWKKQGVTRIVVAREVTLEEAKEIRKNVDAELEMFIHGSMCTSYSGKCTISNYTAERDANRGGCVQSCRFEYDLIDAETNEPEDNANLMNSKDLMALSVIPDFIRCEIDSLKIEGRMKSNLYVANTVAIYRKAVDHFYEKISKNEPYDDFDLVFWQNQLSEVSNRTFETGSLLKTAHGNTIRYETASYNSEVDFIGTVKDVVVGKFLVVEVKSPFSPFENLQIQLCTGEKIKLQPQNVFSISGEKLGKAKPNSLVLLDWVEGVNKFCVLSKLKVAALKG